jgi:single-strand DNA-binding protein
MLIGNVGRDPEMRFTPSGRPVTTFPLITNRSWNTANGERRSESERFNIVAWGNLAEISNQHLSIGMQIYIEGRLQTRRWENKDGIQHLGVEIVANEMLILGDKHDANAHENVKDL